jgi:uncharacterized membrane protein
MAADVPPRPMERTLAVFAYLGPLLLVPLLVRNKIRYLAYHTRQGIYLFAVFVILMSVSLSLLYVVGPRQLDLKIVFNFLAVLFLLEALLYVGTTLYLAVQAGRARMPMLPVLGEMAGER